MARGKGEGSIIWDPQRGRWRGAVVVDGRKYRVDVTPPGASARERNAARVEVRRRLDKLIAEVDSGTPRGDGNLTLGQLLERWSTKVLPTLDISPRTVDSYRWAVRVLTEELGSRRLRRLDADDIEAVFERLATTPGRGKGQRGMSRTALIKLRSVLGQALAWAERRHLSRGNPARIVDLPAAARRPAIGRALTVEEAKRLLTAAADDRLNALWVLMLMLGLRPGEALGLFWMDVDFDRGVIHVRRSLKLERGKPVIDERLKTSRARRSLDAPAALVDALRDHRKRQVAERLHAGAMWAAASPEPVFTTEIGTLLNASNVRRSFLEVIERADLGHLRIYDLRHSAASILSAAGVPIEHIADVLGHDGIRMTALVYRHALSPTVSAARQAMSQAFE